MQRHTFQAAPLLALLTMATFQAGSLAAEVRPHHNALRDRGSLTDVPARLRARGTLTASGAPVAPSAARQAHSPHGALAPEQEQALHHALRQDWRQADTDGDGRLNRTELAAFRQRLQRPAGVPGAGR